MRFIYGNAHAPFIQVSSAQEFFMIEQRPSDSQRHAHALLHRGFIGASGALLIAAFGTDYFYYATSLSQWSNFSAWLITGGLLVMLVAIILLVIDFATGHARRLEPLSFLLVMAAGLLSLINGFIHSRDAWTSVVPQGILLSAVAAILLVIAGARGWRIAMSRTGGNRP
jgi:uncharacterized membrane protein